MSTMADLLRKRIGDDHPGLVEHGKSLTWDEVVRVAERRASWLVQMRSPGPAHLGILLPNGIDYLLWLFAASMARWTIVGINPTRRGDALAEDIRSTHCQLIIADEGGRSLISGLDLTLADDRIIDVREAARNAAESELVDLEESHPDDLLLLLFTSGTTGTPKAVRCTTGRLAGIAETAAPAYGYQRSDVCYCPMPLFHGNALMALVAPGLLVGATIALRPRFSAGSFLDDVRTFGATTFTYVGKAIAYILATPEADSDLDNTLERGFGTEASSGDRARFIERFGCRLVEGYGSSEGGVNIIATPDTPPGALGPALGGADIAVVDPVTGREMAPAVFDEAGVLVNGNEAIGEIVNRDGPGKFEGYYANEEAQASRTKNGWYWTGDLAYRDTDGYFWFAGRGGDWLRVDSENLAATPIESVLSRYPAFAGVAVYAVPDVETSAGDLVMLAAELRASTFDPDDFARWLDAQEDLGTKWAPSYVRLCEKIDETATGKITKVRLQAERWHGSDPVYVRASRDNRYELLTPAMASSLDDRLAKR